MGELVALAKAKPGELNWAGITGALDFNFAGWLKVAGLDMKKVPYRNPVEAANDVATNRVQVYESAVAIAQPQLQAGNIKLLAVVNTARAPVYPDIPTVAEAGQPALTIDGLVGLFGPPTMPMALRQKIAADIKEVMENDAIIKDRLNATAQLFAPGGPEEFAKSIEAQRALIAKNAKDLGIAEKNCRGGRRLDDGAGREALDLHGRFANGASTGESHAPRPSTAAWPSRLVF